MELGIQPLDRVLVQLPNRSEFVSAYFACQKIGAITVMLNDRYRQLEIERLAEISGATTWIVALQYGNTDFLPVVEDVLQLCPQIAHVVTVGREVDKPGFSSLERLIAESEPTEENRSRLTARSPDPRQVAHMGPTGGTTGEPKIVPLTHNSLGCNVEYCSKSWGQHCEDINLIVGSIGHHLPYSKGFLGSVMTLGALVMLDSTDARTICETIERERVTSVIWVPTLAQRLLQFEGLGEFDLSCLKKMHSAGGAAFPELVRDVFGRLRVTSTRWSIWTATLFRPTLPVNFWSKARRCSPATTRTPRRTPRPSTGTGSSRPGMWRRSTKTATSPSPAA
jgi:non-ribosomal peptide synthetase component E (peptide arylation enzyme)